MATGGLAAGAALPTLALTTGTATFGGAGIGFGVGFVHGGLTGAGRWDWNKALAGGLSGAMIGAGVGLAFTGGGGLLPSMLSGALIHGGISGFSTFQNGYTVDKKRCQTRKGVRNLC